MFPLPQAQRFLTPGKGTQCQVAPWNGGRGDTPTSWRGVNHLPGSFPRPRRGLLPRGPRASQDMLWGWGIRLNDARRHLSSLCLSSFVKRGSALSGRAVVRLRRPCMRQLTAHNRRTANVCLPLARLRPYSFAAILLAGSGKRHLPFPGRLLRESCCDQAGAVPGLNKSHRGRSHPCGSVPPIPVPTHRLHSWPPENQTGLLLPRAAPAFQPPPRALCPSAQLTGSSFCEVGRGFFLEPIGHSPCFLLRPRCSGSTSNRSLVPTGPLKHAPEEDPAEC